MRAPQDHSDARFQRASDHVDVFLVEDHGYFRHGLRELLEAHDGSIAVVGDAGTAEAALREIDALRPDVVLMDIHLPGSSGIALTRQLAMSCPLTRVLVLSGSAQDDDVLAAILAGARGYLLKTAPVAELVTAIHSAAAGGSVLSPTVANQLLDHVRRTGVQPVPITPAPELTPRELEVLRLMAAGMENTQIADELVISPRTARNHVASILEKLQMQNRIQAAVYAVKHGLA